MQTQIFWNALRILSADGSTNNDDDDDDDESMMMMNRWWWGIYSKFDEELCWACDKILQSDVVVEAFCQSNVKTNGM